MRDIRSQVFSHLAVVFTVLFWGMSFVSTKMILNTGFPPVTIALIRFIIAMSTYHSLFGALFLIPLALLERNAWVRIDMFVWMHILYLSIICSAAAYFLYLFALSRLEPTVVSSYINLIPVIGAIGGVLILGERLLPVQIFGACAVITGVIFVNLRFPLRS